jgi:hypothetical protein
MKVNKFDHLCNKTEETLPSGNPIIISFPNKTLIWDYEKQDWKIKQKINGKWILLKKEDKISIQLIETCNICKGSLHIVKKTNPSLLDINMRKTTIEKFKRQHYKCGKKKQNPHIDSIKFIIEEENP